MKRRLFAISLAFVVTSIGCAGAIPFMFEVETALETASKVLTAAMIVWEQIKPLVKASDVSDEMEKRISKLSTAIDSLKVAARDATKTDSDRLKLIDDVIQAAKDVAALIETVRPKVTGVEVQLAGLATFHKELRTLEGSRHVRLHPRRTGQQ
jgi:ABC-type transporter Mla subunit MlaD